MASYWFVDASNALVDLDALRVGGKASKDVTRVEQTGGGLLRTRWAVQGRRITAFEIAQAKAQRSTDPLPADESPTPTSTDSDVWAWLRNDPPAGKAGTIKNLGAPSNAWETEYDAAATPPVVHPDGTIVCGTAPPVPAASNGSTSSVNANAVLGVRGAWANPGNAVGASDTNRAVFTSANALESADLDLGFPIPALPAGAAVHSVDVTPQAFASSDSVFPYTVELVDANGNHIGSAAQAANTGGTKTFTGITAAQLAGARVRIRASHNNSTTSASVSVDSCAVVVKYATAASLTYRYRSEVILTSDRVDGSNDYTNFRFAEGKRLRVAFDVLTHGMQSQSADSWNSVFQVLGRAANGSFPYAPVALLAMRDQWRVCHGQGTDVGFTAPHSDEEWARWEFDVLLGRAGVGKVEALLNGVSLGLWTPTAGTFYAGTGNTAVDLSWVYAKHGLYGGANQSPVLPSAVFRNRRLTVSDGDGSNATTWRGPRTAPVPA